MICAQPQGPGPSRSPKPHKPGQLLLGLFLLGYAGIYGCKVGPDYHRPAALGTNSFPSEYAEMVGTNATEWKVASPAAHLPRGAWWQVFGEPELDRLETL